MFFVNTVSFAWKAGSLLSIQADSGVGTKHIAPGALNLYASVDGASRQAFPFHPWNGMPVVWMNSTA